MSAEPNGHEKTDTAAPAAGKSRGNISAALLTAREIDGNFHQPY